MLQINDIKKVYFIGIGGIGMSALARYFHSKKCVVSGFDKTVTPLTKALEESGIPVHYDDNPSLIPKDVQLVVYTPAIPAGHMGLNFYRTGGYPVLKRSEVLELISSSSFNICVAGTHGKTTITTMIAHILRHSEYGCNAFLGGISTNYNTNFWSSPRNVCVIEADEYDRSFLRLHPDVAIISAMDADHLDIYGTEKALQAAFTEFSTRVKKGGLLITRFGLKTFCNSDEHGHLTYSLQNESAGVYAANIQMNQGSYRFDVMMKGNMLDDIILNMGGMHNVENTVAAIAVAHHLGIENRKIKAAVEAFQGVKRRFEYIIKNNSVVFIDDYAHHPEELRALLSGAQTLFPGKKCTLIFQPHLFTRTRDFADEFAVSLDMADEVILLPIYPARELPLEGVTSEMILDKMTNRNKSAMNKEECLGYLQNEYIRELDTEAGALLITAGAGDIDTMVEPIKLIIEKKHSQLGED